VATAIRIEALPARLGDCLLVECERAEGAPWRMLVDGGPSDTWPLLEARLNQLPADSRRIDVAVVTHVDSDHIGGFLPFVESDFARENVRDFWFNGHPHLLDGSRPRSIEQGESLGSVLTGRADGPVLPWNQAFDEHAIVTRDDALVEVTPRGGPRITVLSPNADRLQRLARTWAAVLSRAREKPRDVAEPDRPQPLGDLESLATERSEKDGSPPNGSSIGLLVEHRGASVVLAGDGFGDVLTEGLRAVAADRGLERLPVDAFKLPHHGSRANVFAPLIAVAPAKHYVFSSNGDTFHHPDDVAVARAVVGGPRGATLWFNYRNPRTERWDDDALKDRHGYRVEYPRDDQSGAVLELPSRR